MKINDIPYKEKSSDAEETEDVISKEHYSLLQQLITFPDLSLNMIKIPYL